MKKTMTLIASILMSCAVATTAFASDSPLEKDMKAMGKSFKSANKSEDLASLKSDLMALRTAAADAQKQVPKHLQDQAADSADRKLFAEGMEKLIKEIDATLEIANAGNFETTKANLAKIKAIQSEYHKKLKP